MRLPLLVLVASLLPVCAPAPLPHPALDLGVPEQLQQAVALRSAGCGGGKRLILSFFDAHLETPRSTKHQWWQVGLSWVLHLAERELDCYILLAPSALLCAELHVSFPVAGHTPSCAFSSTPVELKPENDGFIYRYAVLARLAAAGVDVLMTDADWRIHGDVFGLLDSPPLQPYHAVYSKESPLNGGGTFVRGTKAHPAGGAVWAAAEVARRKVEMVHAKALDPQGREPANVFDQNALGTAVMIASNGLLQNEMRPLFANTRAKDHPYWTAHPQPPGVTPEIAWRNTEEMYSLPNATCPVADAAACARWAVFLTRYKLMDQPVVWAPLCTPSDAEHYSAAVPCEKGALAPPWLWALGQLYSEGWSAFGVSSATHFLGVEHGWTPTISGSHAGRVSAMVADGLFDPRIVPMPHPLPPDPGPSASWTAGARSSFAMATTLLAAQFESALAANRTMVLQPLPCDAPWLERCDACRSGILDWRVVQTPDGRCWPVQGGWDSCFNHLHFIWAFQLRDASTSVVERLPLNDLAAARKDCNKWSEVNALAAEKEAHRAHEAG